MIVLLLICQSRQLNFIDILLTVVVLAKTTTVCYKEPLQHKGSRTFKS